MSDREDREDTRTIHEFDAVAALHVLRRWAVERVEAHEAVTVLTDDHVIVSFYPEYPLGVNDDSWKEFHTTSHGQWERRCYDGRGTALRAIESAVAIVVPTDAVVRRTR